MVSWDPAITAHRLFGKLTEDPASRTTPYLPVHHIVSACELCGGHRAAYGWLRTLSHRESGSEDSYLVMRMRKATVGITRDMSEEGGSGAAGIEQVLCVKRAT